MQIEGLIAPGAEDVQTIEKLSYMMGESFMEENWTRATLDALGENVSDERKLELSRETMRLEFTYGTPYPACYATTDLAACTGAYLKSDLNVMLNAPANFTYYKDTTDFFWSSNNANTGRMDLIVYTFPYTDPNTFTEEYLVAKRDSVLKANLPGSFPGSYMQTETRAGVEYTPITLNGKYCGVMRGLWRMQGDMMGGPFVSHTRLDEKNHRVVVAEGFVYAPETDKRNFMRRIEAALFTLRLPGEFEEPVTETLDIPKEKK